MEFTDNKVTIGQLVMSIGRDYECTFFCGKQKTFKSADIAFRPGMGREDVISLLEEIRDSKCNGSCEGCQKRLLRIDPVYHR